MAHADFSIRDDVQVIGEALGGFEPMADIFARALAEQGRGGAALTVYKDGRKVVDLRGGELIERDVQLLFSVTKAITAVVLAHAADRGLVDLDEPFARVWPEFAKASTRTVTANQVLSHRAGLASIDEPLLLAEVLDGRAEELIAQQEPYWEPGTAHGYHSFTYGVLLNGWFRRVTGSTIGQYLAAELATPNELDLWIGLPESQRGRVAHSMVDVQASTPLRRAISEAAAFPPGTTHYLRNEGEFLNNPAVHTADWPAVNAMATASSLAEFFAMTIGEVRGRRLLSRQSLDRMLRTRSEGIDLVLGIRIAFGAGVQRPFPQLPMLSRASFGHEGANGCVAVADPELGLSLSYTTDVFPANSGARMQSIAMMHSTMFCAAEDS